VEFLVDEVVLGQDYFSKYFRLPLPVITPLVFHMHSSNFTPKSGDSTKGLVWSHTRKESLRSPEPEHMKTAYFRTVAQVQRLFVFTEILTAQW